MKFKVNRACVPLISRGIHFPGKFILCHLYALEIESSHGFNSLWSQTSDSTVRFMRLLFLKNTLLVILMKVDGFKAFSPPAPGTPLIAHG